MHGSASELLARRGRCALSGPVHASHPTRFRIIHRQPQSPACRAGSGEDNGGSPLFVLYTKEDCPLCDGLRGKVDGLLARAAFMPSRLTGSTLEVRDIADNPEWHAKYGNQVPVLAALHKGKEVLVPRPTPRVTPDKLQRQLEDALNQASQE